MDGFNLDRVMGPAVDYRDSEVWYPEPYGWSQLTFVYADDCLAYFKHCLKWNRFHRKRFMRMAGK